MSLTTESQNVNALAERFDMTRQAVSLHVKYLEECGVISIKKDGRERYCNLEIQKLTELTEWLEPFRKIWEARFDQLGNLLNILQDKKRTKNE